MLQRWNQTTRRSKKPFRKSNNEKITDKVKISKVKFRGHISCTEDASVWADSYFTTLFNEWMSVQSTNIWASTIWQTGAKIFTLCFTVPLCLRFHLLIRSPVASAPGKQGIMVVSHRHSMVLTYIDVGSVDAVYFIWHSSLELTLFWAAKVVHLADITLPAPRLSALSHVWSVGAWRRVKVLCQVLHHFNKHVLISTGAGKQTLSELPRWQ